MCVFPSVCFVLQRGMLFRSDSVDYRAQGPKMDSGVEAGSDMTPTPAFPISPPTPYGKSLRYCPSVFSQGFVCVCVHMVALVIVAELLNFKPHLFFYASIVKNMAEFTHLRQTPSPSMQSYGAYRTEHGRSLWQCVLYFWRM